MNKAKTITYWITTALLSFGMMGSGITQLLHTKDMDDMMLHLGYPLYLLSILGIWKLLGVLVILLPGFTLFKEWAYAGFFFLLSGALVSHLVMGDEGKAIFAPIGQLLFLILSWYFRPARRKLVPVGEK